MDSKTTGPAPTRTRVRENLCVTLGTSLSVLAVEITLGLFALGQPASGTTGPFALGTAVWGVYVFALIFGMGPVPGVLLSVGVVVGAVTAADVLGGDRGGRGTAKWVLGLVALGAAPLALTLDVDFEGTVLLWLATTVTLAVPALLTNRALRPGSPCLRARALLRCRAWRGAH